MIRKLSVADLLPGMYVVDVHCPWFRHDLWRTKFSVRDAAHVATIAGSGVTQVSIDTERGIDVPAPPEPTMRLNEVERNLRSLTQVKAAMPRKVSLGEERRRATRLLNEAGGTVGELMNAAQGGQLVDAARLEPLVTRMMESVARNPDALIPLARLKQMDRYASEHAVATAALIIALGKQMHIADPELEEMALGSMVKDIGLAALDRRVTEKQGVLSRDEFSVVQSHVEEGLSVLEATGNLPDLSISVVLQHHERFDGTGYPYRMAGQEISQAGRMAAIVDTYDAMTSDRPYRAAMAPPVALTQLYSESGTQFDPELVAAFIRTLGVYPVGTLVQLESGHLAVVDAVNPENSLRPVVRVIYHAARQQYVTPVMVDLAKTVGNHYGQIVRAESYERWGLSPLRWSPV